MPWTAAEFRAKHNKRLSLYQATRAAAIANAALEKGYGEGEAIRIANAAVMGKKGRGRPRYMSTGDKA